MEERLRLWWQKIKTHPITSTLIVLFIAFIVLVILGGYKLNWDWTGFNGNSKSGKTLWDWMQLLFIPVVLAVAGFWFNHRERKAAELRADTERDISEDNQRETALQAYIDKMSEILPAYKIGAELVDPMMKIGRIQTLTVLRRLDGKRKGNVIQFLHESELINERGIRYIDLSRADLTNAVLLGVNLTGAHLSKVDLHGAFMNRANLSLTNLTSANLREAILREAILSGAVLKAANLTGADLTGADLSAPKLYGADFTGANLTGVTGITVEELKKQAKSLKGATLPDGTLHS